MDTGLRRYGDSEWVAKKRTTKMEVSMSLDAQIATLRAEIAAATAAASDETQIEAVRVGALGKKGSVSALLATLGGIAPEERKSAGAAINGLKTEVTALIEARAADLAKAALDARLAS
jgi:phenylalanyl-tRNA synthetase alpha chain